MMRSNRGSAPGIRTLNLAVNRSLQPVQKWRREFAECRRILPISMVCHGRCCTKRAAPSSKSRFNLPAPDFCAPNVMRSTPSLANAESAISITPLSHPSTIENLAQTAVPGFNRRDLSSGDREYEPISHGVRTARRKGRRAGAVGRALHSRLRPGEFGGCSQSNTKRFRRCVTVERCVLNPVCNSSRIRATARPCRHGL
jgi:hypothetical protein